MVAYSFKRQFVEPICDGRKTQTIRAERKRHARPGEALQLYSAMRTKHCFLIGHAVCTDITPIALDFEEATISVGHRNLSKQHDLDRFARADGFKNWMEMCSFWEAEHAAMSRWSGVLIRWYGFVLP